MCVLSVCVLPLCECAGKLIRVEEEHLSAQKDVWCGQARFFSPAGGRLKRV